MKNAVLNQAFQFDMQGKTIPHDARLGDAVSRMTRSGKNCLMVLKTDDKPVGIISEHDIVIAFARLGQKARDSKVWEYMTTDVIAARDTDTIDDALKLMAAHNVRHLPILSEKGSILDFISMMDLVVKKMTL